MDATGAVRSLSAEVKGLLERYARPGPRYTSYPTAPKFTEAYTEADYRAKLSEADRATDEPLSVYLHLPFCRERCHYCGCNVVITKRRDIAARYLVYLHREIDQLARRLPRRREVSQLHWGGGTPTFHTPGEMWALHRKFTERFHLQPDAEQAVEIDPRVTSSEQIDLLRSMGFNRISIGVQDFDPEVQAAVGRDQTEAETRRVFAACRKAGFPSINFDLIYGLPRQTVENFASSIKTVLDLRPDRVAVYSYAHVPWIKAHQKRIDAAELPPSESKLELFCGARQMFLDAGYVQIGMDHFVTPHDELALAAGRRRLHRNFMGYTVKLGTDMLGLGISSIGDVRGGFAQNTRKLSTYYTALDAGRFPIERGYLLSTDDAIRRRVITALMCNFAVGFAEIKRDFGVDFCEYFKTELAALRQPGGPVADGLVRIGEEDLEISDLGRLFVRNICMTFDRYLPREQQGERLFSSTV